MDKMTIRALALAVTLGFLVLTPFAARAQGPLQATQIMVGAPAQSNVGETLVVQALLADSQGRPISKAVIYFTTQTEFLGRTAQVELAQAVTNGKGQATAQFVDDFSGAFPLRAEFRGDAQYAPSNATVQIGAAGDQQVYAEHVGVDIPGFNVPPVSMPVAAVLSSPGQRLALFIRNLWPAMNGWPVAAVLLLVWSTYLFAVTFVFRVAASKNDEQPASTEPRRPL